METGAQLMAFIRKCWHCRPMRRWILIPFLAVVVACGHGAAPPAAAAEFAPRQLPPGAPGFLDVGPGGLTLAPGESTQLTLRTSDSSGQAVGNASTLHWSSSNLAAVTVDAMGAVHAVAAGDAEVAVDDMVHGLRSVQVSVAAIKPAGPVAIRFTPPFLSVAVGQPQQVSFTVTDSSGAPLPGVVPVFTSTSPLVSLDVAGRLSATGPALARISAQVSGVSLVGTLTVVAQQATSAPCPSTTTAVVVGCLPLLPPIVFPRPGASQSEPPRIEIGRLGCFPGSVYPSVSWTQDSPTRVRFSTAGIVGGSAAGDLLPLVPGRTTMTEFFGDLQCGDAIEQSVGPDLTGPWSVTCSDGDHGSWNGANPVPYTIHETYGAYSGHAPGAVPGEGGGPAETGASGHATYCNEKDGFSCTGSVDFTYAIQYGPGLPLTPDWHEGTCTATDPCRVRSQSCGAPRSAAGQNYAVQGWNFTDANNAVSTDGSCTLSRGAPAKLCTAPLQCDGTYLVTTAPATSGHCSIGSFTFNVVVSNGSATLSASVGTPITAPVDGNCIVRVNETDACGSHAFVADLAGGTACSFPFDVTTSSTPPTCDCSVVTSCTVVKK
jgi:hypothetical protein